MPEADVWRNRLCYSPRKVACSEGAPPAIRRGRPPSATSAQQWRPARNAARELRVPRRIDNPDGRARQIDDEVAIVVSRPERRRGWRTARRRQQVQARPTGKDHELESTVRRNGAVG